MNLLLAALLLAAAPAPQPAAPQKAPAATPQKAPATPPKVDVPLPPPPAGAAPRADLSVPPPQHLPPGAKGGALRVAVLDTRVAGDVPKRALAVFDQAIVPEVRKLEGVSAIGMAEIRDMLGFEYQRQMMGCDANDACLAEIAGALGVDELVTPSLVLTGKKYALSVRRLDLRKAKVVQSFDRTLEQRDGEELLTIVGQAVQGLFPDRPLRAGKTRGVEAAVIARLNPPPLPTWVFWATSGAAVVALGGAGVSHALAGQAKDEYDRLIEQGMQEPVDAADLQDAGDRVHGYESTRNALLATSLAFGVAAGVEALFTDWRGDRKAVPKASVAAVPVWTPGGAGLAVAGRF